MKPAATPSYNQVAPFRARPAPVWLVRAFPCLMEHQAIKDNAVKQRVRAFPCLVEHQAVKDNAVKQRVRAFPCLVEHQAVKDNAVKQRFRAKCRFCENSFCSSIGENCHLRALPAFRVNASVHP
jgi:hypothetical protein